MSRLRSAAPDCNSAIPPRGFRHDSEFRVVYLTFNSDAAKTHNKSRRFTRHRDAVAFLEELERRHHLAWVFLEERRILAGPWKAVPR